MDSAESSEPRASTHTGSGGPPSPDEPGDGAGDQPAERQPRERGADVPAELLTRLAHDIRSPLGLLSGSLEELRADLSAQLDDSHQRMFDLAERGLARLHRMANVLQTAGELERGGVELDLAEHDLGEMLRGCVATLERSDPRRNVEVEIDVPKGVVLPLDGPRADEALRELLSQARRNARAHVKVSVDDGDEAVVLRIEDDGIGWSKSRRHVAFDRLYQPEDRSGTGLGLSVSRDLVRAHGGDVVIGDSSLPPGRPGTLGGAFVVTFPR